jgi:hypothetical protein
MVFGFNLRNEDQRFTRQNLAREIAEFEWIIAGAPPDQRAAYEERIQRYEQYPLNVLEREHNRLNEEDDAAIAEALGDIVGVLPINAQVRAINDERRARARAFFGVWKDELTTDAAPHIGTKDVPKGSENFISRDDIEDGDEMVELHGNPAHIYKKSSINQWISKRKEQFPRNPIKNPYTGENIKQRNIKRYTARLKNKDNNKDKNNSPKSGGACGYNRTRRKYGGSKKRKSLRVRYRGHKKQ